MGRIDRHWTGTRYRKGRSRDGHARVATAAVVANGELARLADVASFGLRNFSAATAKDCSSRTTSVNYRDPPSMSRAELGIHGLKSWGRNLSRKVRETRSSSSQKRPEPAAHPCRGPGGQAGDEHGGPP